MSEPNKLDAEERRFTTAPLELSPPIAQASVMRWTAPRIEARSVPYDG